MRAKRFLTWAAAIVLSLNTAAFAAEAAVIVQPGVVIGGGNNADEGPQYSLSGEGEAESGQAVMIITEDGEVIKSGEDTSGELPEGQDAGALAVLGPVRMDYPRVTAILQYVSAQVGRTLTTLLRDQ